MIHFLAILTLAPATAGSQDPPRPVEKADFFREGSAPVHKPLGWDVTIVYFMDYQCPACRQYTPDVARVLKEDRRIRVIYRDTPLLGPRSDAAAAAAIAAHFQGRHAAMHHALMTAKLPLDDAAIRAAAKKAGVDWPRLQRDLEQRQEEIAQLIGHNAELSMVAGVSGTPAFIIGDRLANGALEYKDLKAIISETRLAAGKGNESVSPPAGVDEPANTISSAEPPPARSPALATSPVVASARTDGAVSHAKPRTGLAAWFWISAAAIALVLFLFIVWRPSRKPL